MALRLAVIAYASLAAQVRGEAVEVTEASWAKEVGQKVDKGQFVLVKFLAPWCGHCKKMKPDWDKLAEKFNYKTNAVIADVDCTDDKAKNLCQKFGIQGYPTLKYFAPGLPADGEAYEGDRDYKGLQKFVKKKAKKPCAVDTLANCDKKEKAYIEELASVDRAALEASQAAMEKELAELTANQTAANDLFEKQKEVAMATMKEAEELKKKVSKLHDKNGYKLLILKAKLGGAAKDEL